MRTPISYDIAETIIRDLVQGLEPRRIKIEDILRIVSRHFGVSKSDLLSQRRHRSVVWPRQIGMYLAKQLTQRSLPEIGRRFGNRDHTTVLHAIRKIEGELTDNPRLKDEIDELKKQMADIQKQLDALEKPGVVTVAAAEAAPPVVVEGALPAGVSEQFKWRCIGPANMGGRVTALAVNENDPSNYWVATASGGLLKTVNNGTTFEHQFDTQTTVSIGDVAVSASNPNVLYLGTGENNPRNSVSYGDGVYKSEDGGKTWKNVGLKKSFQVGKILIHPKDPNVAYVGALGRLYGPGGERGVYKTEDGGKTWTRSHFVDDNTGVIDMRMDPTDPNVLIAAFWDHKRDGHDGFFGTPPVPDSYGPVVTHGPGGGLYKTVDGGKTWKKLTDEKLNNGLPTVKTGRIGLDYSRKTKGLLYAIIDTEKGGSGGPTTGRRTARRPRPG
jgi:photosystem II stability/assembly factor-like uncharacterized protein